MKKNDRLESHGVCILILLYLEMLLGHRIVSQDMGTPI